MHFSFVWTGKEAAAAPDEEEEEIFEPDEEIFEPDEGPLPTADAAHQEFSDAIKQPLPGYENYEVLDKTIGFRDDVLVGVTMDSKGVLWVSTYNGRVYKSQDVGENWNEYTVLPEVKQLWGFARQYVLLGSLRKPKVNRAKSTNLSPSGGIGVHSGNYRLLGGDVMGAGTGDSGAAKGGYALDQTPNLAKGGSYSDALRFASASAAGSSGIVLGAGLSNRAPRLSLLLTVLRRPTANISMQRLLATTATRSTWVREITPHPTEPEKVFAATSFGLYRSSDAGQSWYRDFAGMTPKERWIGHIKADPKNPKRMYLGTSRGLFMSDDSGDNWSKNTTVPEISIRRVVIDSTDSRYVYVAGWGGMYRSDDYGATFNFAYYHSIPKRRDVQWMAIDPFNPNVAYLGTADGLMRTNNLRKSTISDWEVVDGLRTVNLKISIVRFCTKHPGHMYMQTKAGLPTINYAANGPENLISETWDYGNSWRELAGNRTMGDVQWFTLDKDDPDSVWVAFSRALVKIQRNSGDASKVDLSTAPLTMANPVLPTLPSLSQVIRAAMVHNELEMSEFVKRLDSLRSRNLLPNKLNITGGFGVWNVGARIEDIQFNDTRYLNVQTHKSWNVTAWASWALPDLVYRQDSAPLMRFQELKMINGVRDKIMTTVHRNYGELQRIAVKQRYEKGMALQTRINLALRAQYLETLIDMTTGGYLTRWKKKAKQQ